jgi:hypothetical protein
MREAEYNKLKGDLDSLIIQKRAQSTHKAIEQVLRRYEEASLR